MGCIYNTEPSPPATLTLTLTPALNSILTTDLGYMRALPGQEPNEHQPGPRTPVLDPQLWHLTP